MTIMLCGHTGAIQSDNSLRCKYLTPSECRKHKCEVCAHKDPGHKTDCRIGTNLERIRMHNFQDAPRDPHSADQIKQTEQIFNSFPAD